MICFPGAGSAAHGGSCHADTACFSTKLLLKKSNLQQGTALYICHHRYRNRRRRWYERQYFQQSVYYLGKVQKENSSFLVRVTDVIILIEKEFIYDRFKMLPYRQRQSFLVYIRGWFHVQGLQVIYRCENRCIRARDLLNKKVNNCFCCLDHESPWYF